jgi:hypothetical protein
MARLEICGEFLVMRLGFWDRIWGFWGRTPRVERRDVYDIVRVDRVWTEALDAESGDSAERICSVILDAMDDARGGSLGRLFLTSPRGWDCQGRVAVSVFRNREGVVALMKPGAPWSMFVVSARSASDLVPGLRNRVLFTP